MTNNNIKNHAIIGKHHHITHIDNNNMIIRNHNDIHNTIIMHNNNINNNIIINIII